MRSPVARSSRSAPACVVVVHVHRLLREVVVVVVHECLVRLVRVLAAGIVSSLAYTSLRSSIIGLLSSVSGVGSSSGGRRISLWILSLVRSVVGSGDLVVSGLPHFSRLILRS